MKQPLMCTSDKMSLRIGIYMSVLVLMIVIHVIMRNHHTKLFRSLIKIMDDVVARYTFALWQHRDEIHQYDKNVGLFFHTMEDMLHDSHASYRSYRDRWFEDINYASSVLPHQIDLPHIDHIRETDESLYTVARLYKVWGSVLSIMTLGLYVLWRQPLHSE